MVGNERNETKVRIKYNETKWKHDLVRVLLSFPLCTCFVNLLFSSFGLIRAFVHFFHSLQLNHIEGQKEINKPQKDRKVIPDPIDDREFQELKEFGKDGILLGLSLEYRCRD